MQSIISVLCSQKPTTFPLPIQDKSSLSHHILLVLDYSHLPLSLSSVFCPSGFYTATLPTFLFFPHFPRDPPTWSSLISIVNVWHIFYFFSPTWHLHVRPLFWNASVLCTVYFHIMEHFIATFWLRFCNCSYCLWSNKIDSLFHMM